MQPMAGEALLEPFLQHDPHALAQRVQHRRHFGMMVEPRRAPVILQLAEVEVVAADDAAAELARGRRLQPRRGGCEGGRTQTADGGQGGKACRRSCWRGGTGSGRAVCRRLGRRLQPALDALAAEQLRLGALVVGDRGHAGRHRQAFLRAADDGVQAPGVGLDRHAAERGDRVDGDQDAALAAGFADGLERLHAAGRRLAVHDRHQIRTAGVDRLDHLLRLEYLAPGLFDRIDLRPEPLRQLGEQIAEAPEDRHEHAVARLDQPGQHRLQAGARRAVDRIRPAIVRAEQLPQHLHRLVHDGGELRIELPQNRMAHRPQHARVGFHRPRRHDRPRRRRQVGVSFHGTLSS